MCGGGVTCYTSAHCKLFLQWAEESGEIQTYSQSAFPADLKSCQSEPRPKKKRVPLVEILLREYSNALSLDLTIYYDKEGLYLPISSFVCKGMYLFSNTQ